MNPARPTDLPERFTYRMIPERRLVLVACRGSFDTYVLAEAMTAIYKAPQWSPGFDILWDIRDIAEWAIEWDDMRAFVDLDREMGDLSGDGRDVVLVDSELHLANLEAYATLSRENPRTVIPTDDLSAAAAELGWTASDLASELDALKRDL